MDDLLRESCGLFYKLLECFTVAVPSALQTANNSNLRIDCRIMRQSLDDTEALLFHDEYSPKIGGEIDARFERDVNVRKQLEKSILTIRKLTEQTCQSPMSQVSV